MEQPRDCRWYFKKEDYGDQDYKFNARGQMERDIRHVSIEEHVVQEH